MNSLSLASLLWFKRATAMTTNWFLDYWTKYCDDVLNKNKKFGIFFQIYPKTCVIQTLISRKQKNKNGDGFFRYVTDWDFISINNKLENQTSSAVATHVYGFSVFFQARLMTSEPTIKQTK
jgi:hypothetical protein